MSLLTLIFDKHFKRFKCSLVLGHIIKRELLSSTVNCTECISWSVEILTMKFPVTGRLEPLYDYDLTFINFNYN